MLVELADAENDFVRGFAVLLHRAIEVIPERHRHERLILAQPTQQTGYLR